MSELLKTLFLTLLKLIDILLNRKHVITLQQQSAAADSIQDTLDNVTSADNVNQLIDNLNKVKQRQVCNTNDDT